jgi:hypothetical protein
MPDVTDIDVQPGDPIRAEQFMMLVDAVRELMSVRGGDGVNVRRAGGRIHLSAIPRVDSYLAVATSNFAARSSTTPGTGTVDLYWFDGSALAATGESLADVVNVSTTTMTSGNSIDSGMYCWVVQDAFGTWFISPLECS